MSDDNSSSSGMPADDMSEYLQMFVDETSEQLDALVETLLVLEDDPTSQPHLNEVFRLVHSIKGSAMLMGLDSIALLTHHLENHFARLRSGLKTLDQPMMDLVLECIDFLRDCVTRLRAGEPLASVPELLEKLAALSEQQHLAEASSSGTSTQATTSRKQPPTQPVPTAESDKSPAHAPRSEPSQVEAARVETAPAASSSSYVLGPINYDEDEDEEQDHSSHDFSPEGASNAIPPETDVSGPLPRRLRILVEFQRDVELPGLRAELVLSRLSEMGEVRRTIPEATELQRVEMLGSLQVLMETHRTDRELRDVADVTGVEQLDIEEVDAAEFDVPTVPPIEAIPKTAPGQSAGVSKSVAKDRNQPAAEAPQDSKLAVNETIRVDIERLDKLMNLTGELVVNRARFVQLARQMSPSFKKSALTNRVRALYGALMRSMEIIQSRSKEEREALPEGLNETILDIQADMAALEEQTEIWEQSRKFFGQINEAIDQLTRVSNSLQRSVLETRMVPVAPLFNRFKRVVRDISHELKKKVKLEIHGERTELDKRMIDQLGDPLVHLVRNAIDHGIESEQLRHERGKSPEGTLTLEAVHAGNNVIIYVRDDGGGINIEKARARIIERGLVTRAAAENLTDREVSEFIWHPGFSTADVVSDISGRGVGMDIVKTRITELNGKIEIDSKFGQGTTFIIRLPLTVAIIRSLLFRLEHGIFAAPIENVREIVSVPRKAIVSVHGRETIEVRREFIPLVDITDIFDWHEIDYKYPSNLGRRSDDKSDMVDVVILVAANRTMGLRVRELRGGQDIVIKSIAENFVHIPGLSGASILGDGSVCLLLDVVAVLDLVNERRRAAVTRQAKADIVLAN